jgi:menaquinone-dependent protoporphyrinogen oxidase
MCLWPTPRNMKRPKILPYILVVSGVLRKSGLRTDIRPADSVKDPGLYTAVVLGSAVYIGKWRKAAAKFLKTNEELLSERPVWLFSSGPTGTADPVELTQGWRFPKGLQPIVDRIKPREIVVFHGELDPEMLNLIEKCMIKQVKAEVGDFRNWDAITAWATAIADTLKNGE